MSWLSKSEEGFELAGSLNPVDFEKLFPKDLQNILITLHRHMQPWRKDLLEARSDRQTLYDSGYTPQYLENHPAHNSNWKVTTIPKDLLDRRVEITGPVNNAKMVINMLNPTSDGSVADMAMLDFEDSMRPTWKNVIDGVKNVIGAVEGTLSFYQASQGSEKEKIYSLSPGKRAHVMIRVRGLHLNEQHILIDGEPISAGLFDLVVTAFHTTQLFIKIQQTPKFYIPKCEHYLEARWWSRLFTRLESLLGVDRGTLRCTFLIETLPAAFQMEEILYEIRERACGLNGGRWDKIFSDIKTLKNHADRILPNRSYIDMSKPWMDNYAKRLIKICHRRGAFAMGGMSAFTPGKDAETRKIQTEKVAADKLREATIGHDGCWVSHPYFIGIARKAFQKQNQLDKQLNDFPDRPDLLPQSSGPKTIDALRTNIRVGIAYKYGWEQGLGCISFENLMEDLATLEISRAQVWQWLNHRIKLDDGTQVTPELVSKLFDEECAKIINSQSEEIADYEEYKAMCAGYLKAADSIRLLFLEQQLPNFFTTYEETKEQNKKITTQGGKHVSQRERTTTTLEL